MVEWKPKNRSEINMDRKVINSDFLVEKRVGEKMAVAIMGVKLGGWGRRRKRTPEEMRKRAVNLLTIALEFPDNAVAALWIILSGAHCGLFTVDKVEPVFAICAVDLAVYGFDQGTQRSFFDRDCLGTAQNVQGGFGRAGSNFFGGTALDSLINNEGLEGLSDRRGGTARAEHEKSCQNKKGGDEKIFRRKFHDLETR